MNTYLLFVIDFKIQFKTMMNYHFFIYLLGKDYKVG